MPKKRDKNFIGVFPAATLSQLEYVLEERQNKDRRKNDTAIDFQDRRKRQRRVASEEYPVRLEENPAELEEIYSVI